MFPFDLPHGPPTRLTRQTAGTLGPDGSGQVFGLAGVCGMLAAFLAPRLPGMLASVSLWGLVPVHRCGAAPDSHRIPFSPGLVRAPALVIF